MRLGLYINLYLTPEENPDLRHALEQVRLAEQAGFSWVVAGERHLHPPGYHEALTSLAWLAARTERIGLATAGLIAPLYHPVWLAEMTAHLDVLSGGRFTLGVVLGYRPEEFALFGVPPRERVPRFEECVTMVKALWTQPSVSIAGRFHRLHDAAISPRPLQRPRPRIWNGGRVAAALERTARLCDGWTASFNATDGEIEESTRVYRNAPAGPDTLAPEVIVCREGYCAPTSQQARADIEPPLRGLYRAYADWKRTSIDARRYHDDWQAIAQRSVIGSPRQCAEALERYRAMGADAVILRLQPPGLGHRETLRAIERFGTEVLPPLAGAATPGTTDAPCREDGLRTR